MRLPPSPKLQSLVFHFALFPMTPPMLMHAHRLACRGKGRLTCMRVVTCRLKGQRPVSRMTISLLCTAPEISCPDTWGRSTQRTHRGAQTVIKLHVLHTIPVPCTASTACHLSCPACPPPTLPLTPALPQPPATPPARSQCGRSSASPRGTA